MFSHLPAEETLIETFDKLNSNGTLEYEPNPTLVPHAAGPFQILFLITSAFTRKPDWGGLVATDRPQELIPGSDINISGFEICNFGSTHILTFNKFAVFRPHLLLVTSDGFKRQSSPLDADDFHAAWDILRAMPRESQWAGIYNCTEMGGCSRIHKHQQFFPLRSLKDKGIALFLNDNFEDNQIPFKILRHRLSVTTTSNDILSIYQGMMRKSRRMLGLDDFQNLPCPHNVVLNRDYLVVIPRRVGYYGNLGANAMAMMGLFPVSSHELYQKWLNAGPRELLEKMAIPRS